MRQILFQVLLRDPFAFGKIDPATGLPCIGLTVLLASVAFVWLAVLWFRKGWNFNQDEIHNGILWCVGIVGSLFAPFWAPVASLPVYGYGMMLMLAFLSGTLLAIPRAKQAGIPEKQIWDVGLWVLVSGVIGARLFFIAQYPGKVFLPGMTFLQQVHSAVNLSQGGIVLYGGVILGGIAYFAFCIKNKIRPIVLADILVPSVFLGLCFGRIGCLLNGCCYGDACSLPWAISFPQNSTTFLVLAGRGLTDPNAPYSIALHPSQIYSAINALVLAMLTYTYYRYRTRTGDVLALAWIVYPITRFLLERVRGDELGQLNTTFTISQFVSFGMVLAGIAFAVFLRMNPAQENHIGIQQPTT